MCQENILMHTLLFHGRTQTERWSQPVEFHYKLKVEEQDFWDTLYNVFGFKQTLCQSSMIIKFIISIG